MARTKQTARRSTGGSAPRKQLTRKSAPLIRSYFQQQQAVGYTNPTCQKRKAIFVNCENTFAGFKFTRPRTNEMFKPSVALMRVPTPKSSKLMMRLDFLSKLDGNITLSDRVPLDIVFSVDISGSMASPFPDDSDRRSKISVACESILKILTNLTSKDRVGLVTFDTDSKVLLPLTFCTETVKNDVTTILTTIRAVGGTALSQGLQSAYIVLKNAEYVGDSRLQRVFFLTDMESTLDDESRVISIAQKEAVPQTIPTTGFKGSKRKRNSAPKMPTNQKIKQEGVSIKKEDVRIKSENEVTSELMDVIPAISARHLSVIGIGIDLSVSTVEKISSIPGAKYFSVISATEFFSSVADDFCYDVLPTAFKIQLSLENQDISFKQFYGSAELNNIPAGSTSVMISTEFPVPLDHNNECFGALYICELNENENQSNLSYPNKQYLTVKWQDSLNGNMCEELLELDIPHPIDQNNKIQNFDIHQIGLYKAVHLADYVELLTDYMTANDVVAGDLTCLPGTIETLRGLTEIGIRNLERTDMLPIDSPVSIVKHHEYLSKFVQFKKLLLSVMEECNDDSLLTTNKSVLQTIDQVIELETNEIKDLLLELKANVVTRDPYPLRRRSEDGRFIKLENVCNVN
eukprot:gene7758-10543_t